MLLTSYGKDYALTWTLFPDTLMLTAGFFILSFLVIGFSLCDQMEDRAKESNGRKENVTPKHHSDGQGKTAVL